MIKLLALYAAAFLVKWDDFNFGGLRDVAGYYESERCNNRFYMPPQRSAAFGRHGPLIDMDKRLRTGKDVGFGSDFMIRSGVSALKPPQEVPFRSSFNDESLNGNYGGSILRTADAPARSYPDADIWKGLNRNANIINSIESNMDLTIANSPVKSNGFDSFKNSNRGVIFVDQGIPLKNSATPFKSGSDMLISDLKLPITNSVENSVKDVQNMVRNRDNAQSLNGIDIRNNINGQEVIIASPDDTVHETLNSVQMLDTPNGEEYAKEWPHLKVRVDSDRMSNPIDEILTRPRMAMIGNAMNPIDLEGARQQAMMLQNFPVRDFVFSQNYPNLVRAGRGGHIIESVQTTSSEKLTASDRHQDKRISDEPANESGIERIDEIQGGDNNMANLYENSDAIQKETNDVEFVDESSNNLSESGGAQISSSVRSRPNILEKFRHNAFKNQDNEKAPSRLSANQDGNKD